MDKQGMADETIRSSPDKVAVNRTIFYRIVNWNKVGGLARGRYYPGRQKYGTVKTTNRIGGKGMLVVTTENIAGYRIERVLGQVFGVTVRSRGIGGNITASLRSVFGGEIKEYTEMIEDARKAAIDRMIQNAHAMGANAVIMMRFDSGEIGQTMSEIVAYGTAVVAEKA